MARPLPLLVAIVLGVAAALLVACGGGGSSENPALLPASRADRLQSEIDGVQSAVESEDCRAAAKAVQKLKREVAKLPKSTDPRLRARLQQGAENLGVVARRDCRVPTPTTETQPTTTTTQPTTTTHTTPTTTTPTTPTTTPTTTTPRTTPTHTTPRTTPTQTTPTTTTGKGKGSGGAGAGAAEKGHGHGAKDKHE